MAKKSGSSIYLDIDVSDAMEKIADLRKVHTPEEMHKIIYRVFRRAGGRVKTILRKQIPQDYNVTASWVGSQVGSPRTQVGVLGGITCTIPIDGKRGTIGGRYGATGGSHGWNALHLRGKRYKIKAKIVKDQVSTLPTVMSHQSNSKNAPFRNYDSPLGKIAFVRVSKSRLPIAKVVGLGVPQMPLNRSKDDVQADIVDTLMKRLEAEHKYIISKCR